MKNEFILTSEQQAFIDTALSGKNVLVDACIGSGKTTAIQYLCNQIQNDKQVLYLTYNRLLKLDAKQKITNPNVCVQNYHGYAYEQLRKKKLNVARDDLLREFNNRSLHLPLIDILIIDEYQDIDSQIARMLKYIKQYYPDMQIIMVGDMCQKIYDNSFLNVTQFAEEFLGNYTNLEFTTCFRLSSGWASELGQTWNKQINGVNTNCTVNYMSEDEVAEYLLTQDPKDILAWVRSLVQIATEQCSISWKHCVQKSLISIQFMRVSERKTQISDLLMITQFLPHMTHLRVLKRKYLYYSTGQQIIGIREVTSHINNMKSCETFFA